MIEILFYLIVFLLISVAHGGCSSVSQMMVLQFPLYVNSAKVYGKYSVISLAITKILPNFASD